MSARPPFHLAIRVADLDAARQFYGDLLGCREGRSAPDWVDFDFHGHQLVCHRVDTPADTPARGSVDGDGVPVPHFGVVLPPGEWRVLMDRLRGAGTRILLGPKTRFAGQPGEQHTVFVADPAGNVLEFKSMRDPAELFRDHSR